METPEPPVIIERPERPPGLVATLSAALGGRPIYGFAWISLLMVDLILFARASQALDRYDAGPRMMIRIATISLVVCALCIVGLMVRKGPWSLIVLDPDSAEIEVSGTLRVAVWVILIFGLVIFARYAFGHP